MALTFNELKDILSSNKAYLNQDGTINNTELHKLAQKCDHHLVDLLASHDETRIEFFMKRGSYHVFTRDLFIDYISHKNFLENSYTKYKTKIGLHDGKDFIKQNRDVVLAFPFKDCVLEGGQTKDDEKRKEIYYNEVLAAEEIDRLLDTKVLTNARRYGAHKDAHKNIQPLDAFQRDAEINKARGTSEHTITDNLIIKGNNLIALHNIKHHFRGKVKLIYIDPPYNTGNDSFHYNDNFNHSTWLVFMKNRLEIARKLLRDDGVIFVQCDDNEQAYLKVLMDEVFGRENFLNDIIWNSTKSVTNTAIISVAHTHTLVFFKKKDYYVKHRSEFRLKETGEGFSNPDNDPRGLWKADPFQVGGWRPNQQYEIINPNTRAIYKPNEGCSWKNDFNKFQELLKNNRIVFGTDEKSAPQRKRFLSEALERGKVSTTIWNDLETTTNGTQHLKRLFNKIIFSNPKPESLLQRIIEISTKPNDIVLDYHIGSGTTCAVAHKMGRQYIGIEQMDYIESITVERLKKVLDGEQGGISKAVQWQGGGGFVYLELKKHNHMFLDRIAEATTTDALVALQADIMQHAFIDYRLDLDEIEQEQDAFQALSLTEQKSVLCGFLDSNQMYVNYSERDDEHYACSDDEKRISQDFYRAST